MKKSFKKSKDIISENEENNTISKKTKRTCIAGALILICMYGISTLYDSYVYPNVIFYSQELGNLNKEKLSDAIDKQGNIIENNKIVVELNNKKYDICVGDIIKIKDIDKTKEYILNYGKDGNFIKKSVSVLLGTNRDFYFDIEINNNNLQKEIGEIYEDTYVKPIEPTLEVKGEKIELIKGKSGKEIDKNELVNTIISKVNSKEITNSNISIQEEYKVKNTKIKDEQLEGVDYKISSATTYFGGTGYNRGLNIENATNKVDGTILMPNEEFSYEEAVSPVTLDNGDYLAPVIVNGTHAQAAGGGVCQLSTTIYNTQLTAGIEPIERHNHSKAIGYAKRGLDATLAEGYKNLRFKNPYDYPIYIDAYTIDGQLTVDFWSNKSVLDGKTYVPVSFINGNVANTYIYGYNNKEELIYKKFIDTSIYN